MWEIVLSDQGYEQSFADAKGHPYLATTLRRQGELITDYYGVAASPLANEIALISGQGPTPQTLTNCPVFAGYHAGHSREVRSGQGRRVPVSLQGADAARPADHGGPHLARVHPGHRTDAAGHVVTEHHGRDARPRPAPATSTAPPAPLDPDTTTRRPGTTSTSAPAQAKTCPHPTIDAADPNQSVSVGDQYVTWRNPFIYFRSLLPGRSAPSTTSASASSPPI